MDCAVGEAEKKEDMEAFFLSPSFGKSSGESFFDFFISSGWNRESRQKSEGEKEKPDGDSKRKASITS